MDENPGNSTTLEHVRKLVPEEIRPLAEDFSDGIDWLRYVTAAHQTTVEVHLPQSDESDAEEGKRTKTKKPMSKKGVELSFVQAALKEAKESWDAELVAFESEHLLVVTSVPKPGSVASGLAYGDLVCGALEAMFHEQNTVPRRREKTEREPLVVYLCSTREEYINLSSAAQRFGASGSWIENSAGHYSPMANLTRMFLPASSAESEETGLESLLQTYAHELTHHWLAVNCPLWRPGEVRSGALMPGFWIVEGFASMVEEFLFDPESQRWTPHNQRSRRCDVLANVAENQIIPWDSFFSMNGREKMGLSFDTVGQVPTSIRLASANRFSETTLFYTQSSATSRYLYSADNGAYREHLWRYLADYYRGQLRRVGEGIDSPDISVRMGTTPEELGERVRSYAKEVVGKN